MLDVELVRTTQNGVTKPWSGFVESVVAREHMPTWEDKEGQEGFQGWNQAAGWREGHEQSEMLCLSEVWALRWTMPKQEEEETTANNFSRN